MIFIQTISILFQIFMIMLFIRILASWVPELNQTKFMQFLSFYTDPYLNVFKRVVPPIGMIDFSPIVAFIFLAILEKVLISLVVLFLK